MPKRHPMQAKPGHWLWEWLERYRIKILKIDREAKEIAKENRIKGVSRTSTMINLQDCDTINQGELKQGAEMKLYSKGHR